MLYKPHLYFNVNSTTCFCLMSKSRFFAMLISKAVASTKAVWKTVLFVTPYIREKRGCAGDIAPIPNFCLEGSTPPIRYSLPGWLVDGGSRAEGILSFVEYAPRLRMVLPSRQLLITRLAKILKSMLKILAENIGRHILPCFARASLRHLDKILS